MSMALCSAGVRLRLLVPLSYHVLHVYTYHDQAQADKSIPRFSPAAARLILLPKQAAPRDLGRPLHYQRRPPFDNRCLGLRSTVCNCFSDAVY